MSFSYAPDSGRLVGEQTVRRAYTYSRTLSYDAFDHLCEDAAAWDSSDLGKYKTTIANTVRGKPIEISVRFNSDSTTIKSSMCTMIAGGKKSSATCQAIQTTRTKYSAPPIFTGQNRQAI